jgi:hypothetical protein
LSILYQGHGTQRQQAWLAERTGQVAVDLSIQGCVVGDCSAAAGEVAM